MSICEFCGKNNQLTYHHLIPKCLHGKKYYQKRYTSKFLNENTIQLCSDCHKEVHKFFNEKELAKKYNTLELLLNNEKIKNYILWIKKQN